MKKNLTIQTNYTRSISTLCRNFSVNTFLLTEALSNPRFLLYIVKVNSLHFGRECRALFSSNSQPTHGVKKYENADRQKVEILEENKGKTAIYMWVNKINGKRYIGSAKDLKRRLQIYYSYKRLQTPMLINKALLKYGYASFSLIVLEYCSPEVLVQREQYWLDTLLPEYNILSNAYSSLGFKHDEETLNKIKAQNNHFCFLEKLTVRKQEKQCQSLRLEKN